MRLGYLHVMDDRNVDIGTDVVLQLSPCLEGETHPCPPPSKWFWILGGIGKREGERTQ